LATLAAAQGALDISGELDMDWSWRFLTWQVSENLSGLRKALDLFSAIAYTPAIRTFNHISDNNYQDKKW